MDTTPDQETTDLAMVASTLEPVMCSPEFQHLMQVGLMGSRLPQTLRSKRAAAAFQQAFDLIGGVPRLALWADQNPDKFYSLYSKLIPTSIEAKTQSKLDITLSWLSESRLAYKGESRVIEGEIVAPPPATSDPK